MNHVMWTSFQTKNQPFCTQQVALIARKKKLPNKKPFCKVITSPYIINMIFMIGLALIKRFCLQFLHYHSTMIQKAGNPKEQPKFGTQLKGKILKRPSEVISWTLLQVHIPKLINPKNIWRMDESVRYSNPKVESWGMPQH